MHTAPIVGGCVLYWQKGYTPEVTVKYLVPKYQCWLAFVGALLLVVHM